MEKIYSQSPRRRNIHSPLKHMSSPSSPMVLNPGVAAQSSQTSVMDIKNYNEKEKKELRGLNEKLANYFENTRFLEAQNKHLKDLLKKSSANFNIDIIKDSYKAEMNIFTRNLKEKDDRIAALLSENQSLAEEVEHLNAQLCHVEATNDQLHLAINGLHDDMAHITAETEKYKWRTNDLEHRLAKSKEKCDLLESQFDALRQDLQNETTERLTQTSKVQSLEDELSYLTDVHSAEVKEYQAMLSKKQKVPDFQETWRAETGNIVAELRAEYEAQIKDIKDQLTARHNVQLQQLSLSQKPREADTVKVKNIKAVHSEREDLERLYENMVSDLRKKVKALEAELDKADQQHMNEKAEFQSEIDSLRLELELMLKELNGLLDSKLSLELDIAAYRKLLEGEESRTSIPEVVTAIGGYQTESENLLARALVDIPTVTMKRTTKGNVSIVELDSGGKYIQIEDTSKSPKEPSNLKGWKLVQTLANGKNFTHTFTDGDVFKDAKLIKIWGSNHGSGKDGITSSSVSEWSALNHSSNIILKDNNDKEYAALSININ
ncbi:hypothetical protein Ahia01_000981600 [Argonauta hians]